jgi:hypothetical protein
MLDEGEKEGRIDNAKDQFYPVGLTAFTRE